MMKFITTLDNCSNPKPGRGSNTRERRDPKEKELPWMLTLKGRTRRWMVKEEWLAKNHDHNDVPARLADSGKLWGDKEDPEEVEERVAKVKEEKKQNKKRKDATSAGGGSTKKAKKGKGQAEEAEKVAGGENGGCKDGEDRVANVGPSASAGV